MEIFVKLSVLVYSLYLLVSYCKGATMWAPYHTLPNLRENATWRGLHAFVALLMAIAACYWLIRDVLV